MVSYVVKDLRRHHILESKEGSVERYANLLHTSRTLVNNDTGHCEAKEMGETCMEKIGSKAASRVCRFALSHLSLLCRAILKLELFSQFETPTKALRTKAVRFSSN